MIYGKYLVSLTLFRPTNHHYIVQTCSHWAVGSRVTPPLKQTPHPPRNIFVTTWAKSTFKATFSYPDYFKTLSHMFFSHRGRTVSDRPDCNRGHRFNSLTTPLFFVFFCQSAFEPENLVCANSLWQPLKVKSNYI